LEKGLAIDFGHDEVAGFVASNDGLAIFAFADNALLLCVSFNDGCAIFFFGVDDFSIAIFFDDGLFRLGVQLGLLVFASRT
jgi:hypothetical protein